jgi:hypothetical protein
MFIISFEAKMKRELFRCKYCEQTSPRRWNMAIHVQRRHSGMENPFKIPSNGTNYNGKLPWSSSHHQISNYHHEGNNARALVEDFSLSKEAINSEEKDPGNSLMDDIYQAIKIRNLVNQAKPNSQPPAPDFTSLMISSALSRNFDFGILLLLLTAIQGKNIGFRGNICTKCYTWWTFQ